MKFLGGWIFHFSYWFWMGLTTVQRYCAACDVGMYVTACTVVQAVVKATSQSNGKGQILTAWGSENPWTDFGETWNIWSGRGCAHIRKSILRCDNVGGLGEHVKKNTCCGFLDIPFLLYSLAHAEPAQLDRFWRSIRRTTCFRPRMCVLWVSFILLSILGVKYPQKPLFWGRE